MSRSARLALVVVLTASLITVAVVAVTAGPERARDVTPTSKASEPPPARQHCTSCHDDVLEHDVVHGPLRLNGHACSACHHLEDGERHSFTLASGDGALCRQCHDLRLGDAAVLHAPFAEGDCLVCHGPHGGTGAAILTSESAGALCRDCHGPMGPDATFRHAPVEAGECTACHDPHASSASGLLVDVGRALCTDCHEAVQASLDELPFVHGPAAQDCQACHDPHAADHAPLLREEPGALCLSCHEGLGATGSGSAGHAAPGDRQCLSCHAPHASEHESVLVAEPESLCLSCHDRTIELSSGEQLANTGAEIADAIHLHGPVADGDCAACHRAHGGQHDRLLVEAYPSTFYAPYARERYALCFRCHDPSLAEEEESTDTGFRDGDRNLHFVHVNDEKQGRTCRACHATHGSRAEHLVRDRVPFGTSGWELAIGFTKTATGGSCATGCHQPAGYERTGPLPAALRN